MVRITSVLIMVLVVITGVARGIEFVCFDSPADQAERASDRYDLEGDEIAMALVFVGFPASGDTAMIRPSFHGQFKDLFTNWLESQTYGKFSVSDDSFILLPPGAQPDATGRIPTWDAYAERGEYASPDSLPADYPYLAELSAWWSPGMGYAGTVFAEILYKIHEAYRDSTAIDLFPAQSNVKTMGSTLFLPCGYVSGPDLGRPLLLQ